MSVKFTASTITNVFL